MCSVFCPAPAGGACIPPLHAHTDHLSSCWQLSSSRGRAPLIPTPCPPTLSPAFNLSIGASSILVVCWVVPVSSKLSQGHRWLLLASSLYTVNTQWLQFKRMNQWTPPRLYSLGAEAAEGLRGSRVVSYWWEVTSKGMEQVESVNPMFWGFFFFSFFIRSEQ